ncbi:MAG TPA: autoinducer binding domain-containing protein [Gammaproteobacteria bacterium]|nr:autoinducer binding domain-containing protein [Gammaproteobacteria bacterium]
MKFSDYQHALKTAQSIEKLNQTLRFFLESFSIKTFSFTYFAYYQNSNHRLHYEFCTDNLKPWHQHYLEERYQDIDSTMDETSKTTLPTAWDLQEQLKHARSERERKMRLDSIAFGAEQGLSIPLYGPGKDLAILTLIQMRGEQCAEQWQKNESVLFAAAHYYQGYLQKQLLISQLNDKDSPLKKRELQCLQLIAKHYSVSQIAKALHITERTVNFHIQLLNKKLGAKNKYESLMKAMEEGLITP